MHSSSGISHRSNTEDDNKDKKSAYASDFSCDVRRDIINNKAIAASAWRCPSQLLNARSCYLILEHYPDTQRKLPLEGQKQRSRKCRQIFSCSKIYQGLRDQTVPGSKGS